MLYRIRLLILISLIIHTGFAQTAPREVGYRPEDAFAYKDLQMPNYWLKWSADPWYPGGSSAWLSGYGGIKLFTGRSPRFVINIAGKVGVGTDAPQALFHIGQNDAAQNSPRAPILLSRYWAAGTDTRASSIFQYSDGSNDKMVLAVSGNGGSNSSPVNITQAKMVIQANGNVGIGTTTPSSKLSVNGTINAKEVNVTIDNWPDYVFNPERRLLPIDSLADKIQKLGHLPDMPSAQEIKLHGANVAELLLKQQEKIEELSLYIIKLYRKLEALENHSY